MIITSEVVILILQLHDAHERRYESCSWQVSSRGIFCALRDEGFPALWQSHFLRFEDKFLADLSSFSKTKLDRSKKTADGLVAKRKSRLIQDLCVSEIMGVSFFSCTYNLSFQ